MKTAAQHLTRFPQARSTTLSNLIAYEKTHDRLRKEVEAMRHPLRAWLRKFLWRA